MCFWVFDVSQRGMKNKTTVGDVGKHRHSYHQPFPLSSGFNSRSQWPRGLSRGPAAARFLGLRFRIPPGKWIFVSCECCVLSGRGLCVGLITCPEGFSEYDRDAPQGEVMTRNRVEAPMESSCNTQCLRIHSLYHGRFIWNKV